MAQRNTSSSHIICNMFLGTPPVVAEAILGIASYIHPASCVEDAHELCDPENGMIARDAHKSTPKEALAQISNAQMRSNPGLIAITQLRSRSSDTLNVLMATCGPAITAPLRASQKH